MKVKRKNVFVRDDCFHATERGSLVRVEAHGNIIKVQTTGGYMECSLSVFEDILEEAISRHIDETNQHPEPQP